MVFNLLAAQYGTISDIEIVWLNIALVGFFLAIWNLRDAIKDRNVLKEAGVENGRSVLAFSSVLAESVRLFIQVIFIAIGVGAMTLSDPPNLADLPPRQVIVSVLIRWGIILSAALIVFKSGLWRWTRGRLEQEYRLADLRESAKDDRHQNELKESQKETAVLRIENAEITGEAEIVKRGSEHQ